MDKLEVSPRSVRGYGNIIIPKLSTDFVGKYNEIYTDSDGYFVLSYGGVMLKASATVSNTIKGIQASLTVLVSTRDSDTPVSGLSVACSVDDTALTSQTTDSTGKCTFTWTPSTLGDSSLVISVTPQDDYAGLSLDKTVTVGLLLGFDGIMTSLSLEDDEVYSGTFEEDVEDRSQLSEFVKDVWVASGGEPIVDEYGIIHICEPGDLVVESEGLEQLPEYSNVLFEEDVELLTGAVYDMSISEDYEIVLDCLERDDIVPPEPTVSVVLTSSESSVYIGDSVTYTATCTFGGEPIVGETVSFYDWDNLVGSSETDSDGVATYTVSSLTAGNHRVSAVCEDTESNRVYVYAYKFQSSISLSVPATGTVGTAYTVSGTLVPTSGTVRLYENWVPKYNLTVSDGVFSKSFTKETSGTYWYQATFDGDSEYEAIQSDWVAIVVSDAPPVPSYDGVSLTADKSILSYADSDTCTLSAQLTDNGSPVSIDGVTVEFFKGSTSLGTANTNSSGVATKSYASAGSGDMTLTAGVDSIISSEIYVCDALVYRPNEATISENASTDKCTPLDNNLSISLPSSFELTFKQKNTNKQYIRFGLVPVANKGNGNPQRSIYGQQTPSTYVGVYRDTGTRGVGSDTSTTGTEYHDWKIIRNGNTFKWYFDGVQINSDVTLTWFDTYNPYCLAWQYAHNGTAYVKEVKIKPL